MRAVRLALEEKGVRYELVPIDIFSSEGVPAEYKARHPFGKIPAFQHGGFRLYQAGAITRYVDEAFAGPPLQPSEPRGRARMNQIISILDSYAYRTLVWDIYVERVSRPASGIAANAERIAGVLPKAAVCLSAWSELMDESPGSLDRRSAWPISTRLRCWRFSDWLPRVRVFWVSTINYRDGGIALAHARALRTPRCRRSMPQRPKGCHATHEKMDGPQRCIRTDSRTPMRAKAREFDLRRTVFCFATATLAGISASTIVGGSGNVFHGRYSEWLRPPKRPQSDEH